MMTNRLRTAARLTSKPMTPYEKEQAGYDAGRRDALNGRDRRRFYRVEDDDYADGYGRGYARVACNEMTGR